jgi:hypothetical protein
MEPVTSKAVLQVRCNLSIDHLRGAAVLAAGCAPLERDNKWPATEQILVRHRTCAASAVILSVCSLEAAINDLHQNAIDRSDHKLGRASRFADRIESLWDTIERASLLRKYEWILSLAGLLAYDHGKKPYQSASDVIELRDALVHWKPEWSGDPRYSDALEKRLTGKFPLNGLSMPDQLFIPYRCCGHGSGAWAVRSAMEFLIDFSGRLEVEPAISHWVPEIESLLA